MEKVALLGMMAAGKSTLGRIVTERLAVPFIDVDEELERQGGMRIADMFRRHGEDEFRRRERGVIAGLLEQPGPAVLALGGGAFAQEAIREMLRGRALSVYLRVSPEELVKRLDRTDRSDRPLLSRVEDWRRAARELAMARDPQYMNADVVFPADSNDIRSMGERLAQVVSRLSRCGAGACLETVHA